MGCQTETAEKIRERKADYVLALKDNQKLLHEDVNDYFDWILNHPALKCRGWVATESRISG